MNKITTLCQAVASISYFSSRMNRSSQLGKRTSLPFAFTLVLTFLLSLVRVGDVWGQAWTIGTGTASISTSGITPFSTYYHDGRTQYVYLASELTAAGMTAGLIHQFGFDFSAVGGQPASNVNLKMANTNASVITSLQSPTWTTVWSSSTVSPTTSTTAGSGFNMWTLSTPFSWNGSSNIIVEICFDNTSYTSNWGVRCTNFASGITYTYGLINDDVSGCTMTSGYIASAGNRRNRPNARFYRNIPCTAPATQASSITFGSTTSTSTSVNWTNGNGGGRVVYINSSNSFTAPTNGTNPTAATAWANTGQQCIFNGTGSGPVTVTGLSASTTYYVRVYEYCTPDRNYQTASATGNSNSFTTAAPTPTITTTGSIAFANQCANTTSTASSFTVSGQYLTNNISIGAVTGYTYSTSVNGSYTSTLTLTQASGSVPTTTIFVKFTPTAATTYNGPIVVSSAGATSQNVTVSGTGVNTTISSQPSSSNVTYCNGTTATSLSVGAAAASGSNFSYQWYSNTTNSTSGGTAIGTNTSSYTLLLCCKWMWH